MENPFLFGAAITGKWFTDREEDTKRLEANFRHAIHTIIISPRRWGKTSLVLKTADNIKDTQLKIVKIDVFSCRTPEDFYLTFAVEVIKQTANKWEEWVENVKQFLSNLRPKISFGVDPASEFSLSFDFSNKQLNEEVLHLPQRIAKQKNIRIVVCLDEFQQIAEFPDAITFQKKLRGVWQLQSPEVTYCLYGSKKHLLNTLFLKQSMPFYKFGDVLFLKKIETEYWVKYICERFVQTGKTISEELAHAICGTVENHSSYVQQLSWLIWTRTDSIATESEFSQALEDLLNQNSILYYNYLGGLTSLQINFLRAISDGIHTGFSRMEILENYKLGTSANITRVRKSLEDRELIDISHESITFNDPVFQLWFKKEVHPKSL